ncbi:hypothetical protein CERSUDRAFT_118729 [Gelatoporia subvermispora B]|uniref:Nucleoporin NDC1 n=1 Tax=Ceriporiopsis subvermispora (strain B) TaxID=914234 RepID=M2R0I2_CERS8|nr:hypothetical protein CERSUDRAFT_118729 [Gelatoporia subvermispora B]
MPDTPAALAKSTSATPVRAIRTPLSTRVALSLPPASQTYEPHVKAALRHRLLYHIFAPSFLVSWLLVTIWSVWMQGGLSGLGLGGFLSAPLSPWTLSFAAVFWCLGVVPVVVVRKNYLTVTPTASLSPSTVFQSTLTKTSTPPALLAYLCSSTLVTFMYIFMTYVYGSSSSEDRHLSFFVKSKKHPYYLNGRVLYLISSQMVISAAYFFRNALLDRFVVHWTELSTTTNPVQARTVRLAQLLTMLVTVGIFSGLCVAGHTLLFGLARSIALPVVFRIPIVSRFLRPFMAHFLRGRFTLTLLARHWSLITRTFYLGITTLAGWEFAESAFDEAVSVSHHTGAPTHILVSGTTTADAYYKHFAYSELRELACDESPSGSARRTELFADQKYNPSLWATLAREALLILGRDYQLLLRKGQPEIPAPAPPPPPAQAKPPLPAQPIQIIRGPVLKASPSSPLRNALDTIASDGALPAAVSSTAEAAHLPELFRSVLHTDTAAQTAVATLRKKEEDVKGLVQRTHNRWRDALAAFAEDGLPKGVLEAVTEVRGWWSRERVHKRVEASLPNRQLDVLVVDVLSAFVCASLAEDQYGVVQRDIPKILEALLSFLQAVEDYQAEVNAMYTPPSQEEFANLSPKEIVQKDILAMEVARASETLSEASDALKDGVVHIVRTFGDKLTAFKFPPRTARKLQGFVDYS